MTTQPDDTARLSLFWEGLSPQFARQPRLGWDAWGYGVETPERVS